MFRKNPVVAIELDYLREVAPHRWWHFLLMLPVFALASIPVFYPFNRSNGDIVVIMAIIIVGAYWIIQFRTLHMAVKVARHDWQSGAPDTLIGTVSNRQIVVGKLWAVLRHQRVWIVLVAIALLGLSLAVIGYLVRNAYASTWGWDIWRNVGLLGYVYPSHWSWSDHSSRTLPHIVQLLIAQSVILLTSSSMTGLITSIGIRWGARRRFWWIVLIIIVLIMFACVICIALFYIRISIDELPRYRCWDVSACDTWRFERFVIRLTESLYISSTAFLDGGMLIVARILCPGNGYVLSSGDIYTSNNSVVLTMGDIRHLLAATLSITINITLSAFFLHRAARMSGEKKKPV